VALHTLRLGDYRVSDIFRVRCVLRRLSIIIICSGSRGFARRGTTCILTLESLSHGSWSSDVSKLDLKQKTSNDR
jgi:hypothetical protein